MNAELKTAAFRAEAAALRFRLAAIRLRLALRYNPSWHLQPRAPAGRPEGGEWVVAGPLVPLGLPLLIRFAPAVLRALRERARQIAPRLWDLPHLWSGEEPKEEEFDDPTRRVGRPTPRRPDHAQLRFRTGRELRDYLGPAGPGRQWHHIVEARLAVRRFPPELIHSTDNVVSLPEEVHRRVSARMSQKLSFTERKTLREWLEPRSFEEQYNYGLNLIREILEDIQP